MNITVFNKKGGTGKTSLSFNLAKDKNFFLLSNDDSVIEDIYPEKSKILETLTIPNGGNIVFDLGGYIDKGIVNVFKESDIVIIPTTLDINSIKRTINTVIEINPYCKDIIIVINRVKKQTLDKYKQSIEALKGLGKEIFYINESEGMVNSIHLGKTITELHNHNKLSKSQYKNIYKQYNKLLERLS